MRHIILSTVTTEHNCQLSTEHNCQLLSTEHKMCVLILSEILFILRRTDRDIIIYERFIYFILYIFILYCIIIYYYYIIYFFIYFNDS